MLCPDNTFLLVTFLMLFISVDSFIISAIIGLIIYTTDEMGLVLYLFLYIYA